MEAVDTKGEDSQKKKRRKFRLFGKKKSKPDPNCPQCNAVRAAATKARAKQQDRYDQQQRDANDSSPELAEDEVPCDCPECQRNRSEHLTVELLPMDAQVVMQNTGFMCNLL